MVMVIANGIHTSFLFIQATVSLDCLVRGNDRRGYRASQCSSAN